MNETVRNTSCFIYEKKEKHCGQFVGSQYVHGTKDKFNEKKNKIHQLHIFGPILKISPQCMTLLFNVYCLWFFPPCDFSSHVPQPRHFCRESCDYIVNGICKNESLALLNIAADKAHNDLLDINALNCSLYNSSNAGGTPECYQYHDVPGRPILFLLFIEPFIIAQLSTVWRFLSKYSQGSIGYQYR